MSRKLHAACCLPHASLTVQRQAGDQRQESDLLTVRQRLDANSVRLDCAVRKLRELRNYREIRGAFCSP